jgi:hypothetical protein
MSIPGFTAENSVSYSDEPRIWSVRPMESIVSQRITPQLFQRPVVDCDFLECRQIAGHLVCWCA